MFRFSAFWGPHAYMNWDCGSKATGFVSTEAQSKLRSSDSNKTVSGLGFRSVVAFITGTPSTQDLILTAVPE